MVVPHTSNALQNTLPVLCYITAAMAIVFIMAATRLARQTQS
jgi:hypothetical protein